MCVGTVANFTQITFQNTGYSNICICLRHCRFIFFYYSLVSHGTNSSRRYVWAHSDTAAQFYLQWYRRAKELRANLLFSVLSLSSFYQGRCPQPQTSYALFFRFLGRFWKPRLFCVCLEGAFWCNDVIILCLSPIAQGRHLHCSTSSTHFIHWEFGEIKQLAAELSFYWMAIHTGERDMLLHHTDFTLKSLT